MSGSGQEKVTVLLHLGEESYVGHGENIEQAKRRTSAGALMLTYYTYKTLPKELDKYKPERKKNSYITLRTIFLGAVHKLCNAKMDHFNGIVYNSIQLKLIPQPFNLSLQLLDE